VITLCLYVVLLLLGSRVGGEARPRMSAGTSSSGKSKQLSSSVAGETDQAPKSNQRGLDVERYPLYLLAYCSACSAKLTYCGATLQLSANRDTTC
jgi:hypothetical protein